jgi:hypothetical protein
MMVAHRLWPTEMRLSRILQFRWPKEPLTEAEKRDSIRLRLTMPRCELDRGHPAATPRSEMNSHRLK